MTPELRNKIEEWRSHLLDTSKRNKLVNLKIGKTGSIELIHPEPDKIWNIIINEEVTMRFPTKCFLVGIEPTEDDSEIDYLSDFNANLTNRPEDPSVIKTKIDERNDSKQNAFIFKEIDSSLSKTKNHTNNFMERPLSTNRTNLKSSNLTKVENISLEDCIESVKLESNHILTDLSDKQMRNKIGRLAINAKNSLTEQGVPTLYLSFGLLKWFESIESEEPIFSPLLLIPVELVRENVQSPWDLRLQESEVIPNFSLIQLLASNFNIKFPDTSFIQENELSDLKEKYFKSVKKVIKNQARWEIEDKCSLGIFSFQKIAMWDDIGKNAELILGHDICRAIAGDKSVQINEHINLPRAEELDTIVNPINTFNILDADSSQQEAIEAVKRGASLVLIGPPGTGKSQTIANIIAEFLAERKTVLFVSEKSAALEVVKRRLDNRNLGEFCLECHSHKANKKTVIDELGSRINLSAEVYQDQTNELMKLSGIKSSLNNYVQSLHKIQQPLNYSLFQVLGKLAKLNSFKTSIFNIENVMSTNQGTLVHNLNLIKSLSDCKNAIIDSDKHPWRGLRFPINEFTLRHDTEYHLNRLNIGLTKLQPITQELIQLDVLKPDFTMIDLINTIKEFAELKSFPDISSNWFNNNPRQLVIEYQSLQSLLIEYDRLHNRLKCFTDSTIHSLSQLNLQNFQEISEHSEQNKYLGKTVREYCTIANTYIIKFTNYKKAVDNLFNSLEHAMIGLGIRPKNISLRIALQLTHIILKLDEVVPIKSVWLDPIRQKEIRKFIVKYKQDMDIISDYRNKLFDKLVPKSFSCEVQNIVHKSLNYKFFIFRFLPSWWQLKRQLMKLYLSPTSNTKTILKDMLELSEYHSRIEILNQIIDQYSDNLVFRRDGSIDYDRLNSSLSACEFINTFIADYPKLREILTKEDEIDFIAIKDTLKYLQESHKLYLDIESELNNMIDVKKLLENCDFKTSSEFTTFLDNLIQSSQDRLSYVNDFKQLLEPSSDVDMSQLSVFIMDAQEIRILNQKIIFLAEKLGLSIENINDLRNSVDKSLLIANWITAFLDHHNDTPPKYLLRALKDKYYREMIDSIASQEIISKNTELVESWNYLVNLFDEETVVSTGIFLQRCSVYSINEWIKLRLLDLDRIGEWAKYLQVKNSLADIGLLQIIEEIKTNCYETEEAEKAYMKKFYLNWLGNVFQREPLMSRFDGTNHEQLIKSFREVDESSVRNSYKRIRERLLSDSARFNTSYLNAPNNSELGILMREINKKRRHMPLRQLFAKSPTVIQRLKPCMMMSPLAVSTYLNTKDIKFDVVIFDEASQVRPFDAITSIYRCKQLVVAGDQKQLPPTSFFERSIAEDEISSEDLIPDEKISDFESILDVCLTLGITKKGLRWHYRSRREPLIAFSNMHFYNNELITFPSVEDTGSAPAVKFEYVDNGTWKSSSQGGFNRREAQRIAELVMGHFRNNPDKSLGVIAFSQKQQLAVLDELERLRRSDLSMEEFFSDDREEPFFVKNLENVQGDERDYIFLGVGYGPDESGKVAMRFGPLNRQGGERRLNVAVTRARQSITIVSSMKYFHIDPNRTNSIGVRLLRAYLEFAERGVAALVSQITQVSDAVYDSEFEKCVAEALREKGLEVRTQVGCSGYRIDLALVDHENPGRFILGIECDGATYHNSATARDRDRLRQDVLESLGWKIVRVWSTDWIKNPSKQVERIISEYNQRIVFLKSNTLNDFDTAKEVTDYELPKIVEDNQSLLDSDEKDFNFSKIDDVPEIVLEDLIISCLKVYGITEQTELIKSVSKKLGFQRTGNKIQARLIQSITKLQKRKMIIRMDDDRINVT